VQQLAEVQRRINELDDERMSLVVTASDIKREVTKAEDDVQSVRAREARDNARLESGQGSPKDLQALQSELEVLARRRGALEDVELEAMERLENAEMSVDAIAAQVAALRADATELERQRDEAFVGLDAEHEEATVERNNSAFGLDPELMALYEKLRASHSGVGAAALQGGTCLGCHMTLNPVDLSRIGAMPEDQIARCEECGRILVRSEAA
jgi:predicted  nucleic acid-binding Zn-ribbon protein